MSYTKMMTTYHFVNHYFANHLFCELLFWTTIDVGDDVGDDVGNDWCVSAIARYIKKKANNDNSRILL